jgi:hypothetical protein
VLSGFTSHPPLPVPGAVISGAALTKTIIEKEEWND